MQLLLLVAGIVGVVLNEQFDNQHTLGWVLIGLAVFLVLLQLALTAFVFNKVDKIGNGYRSNFGRNRRGF